MATLLDKNEACVTVELKINFLSACTGENVVAKAQVLKMGRTVCVARSDVEADGKPISTALITLQPIKFEVPGG